MPGCVLRASGADFDVAGYLAVSPLQPCAVFHRGQPRTPGSPRRNDSSGFNLVVSSAEGDCVPLQVCEAATFVASHRAELARLAVWPGVEALTLDFGWDFPSEGVVGQYNYFPPELLADCGRLGLGIEVSVYAVSAKATEERTEQDSAVRRRGEEAEDA